MLKNDSTGRRDWTPEELDDIEANPGKWARTRKLTDEQVKALRTRIDSLSMPWTVEELAREFGISDDQVRLIAGRKRWTEPIHEPDGPKYWRKEET